MQVNDAKELLKKYREGNATDAEKALFGDWVFFGKLKDLDLTAEEIKLEIQLMEQGLPLKKSKNYKLWPSISVAAAVLLCCLCTIYYLNHHDVKKPVIVAKTIKNEVLPGSNKAILTLANGKHIVLDDAKSGKLAVQNNVSITKTKDGKIIYSAYGQGEGGSATNKIDYNTITTPRGGEYQVILPDGSHVWLNASSSITYPSSFTGNKRQVKLIGEAYFEIAKNPEKPFNVNVNDKQQVEVLGTHFNVMAYSDDNAIQTTLIEGSVKLINGDNKEILKPGQQGILEKQKGAFNIQNVNSDDFIAWKNGMFIFNYENITDIMKKVSRWYDVDVIFKGNMQNVNFVGNYSRNKNLSNLLKYIELSKKAHFIIEGRRVTVIAN